MIFLITEVIVITALIASFVFTATVSVNLLALSTLATSGALRGLPEAAEITRRCVARG
jgi:hypothetical protein